MKKIVINSKVRHGKPVIEGTKITVDDVIGMLESGMSYEEIYKEYKITREDILSVIKYLSSLVRGEEVRKISE